jgi:HSP20 family protein
MAKTSTKVPVKSSESTSAATPPALAGWQPFDSLRHEIERLFEDFDHGRWRVPFRRSLFDLEPLWRHEFAPGGSPAVDIVDKDKAYEITADLPGMEEKDIEISLTDGALTIKGTKQEEKEEKDKGYYLKERRFGSFERRFRVPDGVSTDKIEAAFKNGVLTVTLPKTAEAKKPAKTIKVKSAT